jgi:peptidoglycan/xylan/chitin deacetylase (PgdA/CDA1 family)
MFAAFPRPSIEPLPGAGHEEPWGNTQGAHRQPARAFGRRPGRLCDARAVTWTKRGRVPGSPERRAAGVLAAVVLTIGTVSLSGGASPALAQPVPRTVVTFTWGGGFANQMGSLPLFRRYGMHATFYVPSGLVCQPSSDPGCEHLPYLTLSQVRQIAAAGNEIGGLSVNHIPLNDLPAAEAQREICDDRVNLTRWGFRVTDFAYPFALVTPTMQALTQRCGYNSGLGTGQLRGAGLCSGCPFAETIPPLNPFDLRTPIEVASVGTTWSPATFEDIVTGAEQHGGGWIIFTIHDVCARNCSLGVTMPELNSVLSWLSRRQANGVSVRTVSQVIKGPVRPAVAGPRPPGIPPPGVINSRLTDVTAGSVPACYQRARYGTNHAAFRYSRRGGPDGAGAEVISLTQRKSGTAQLLPTLDLGQCAPAASAGHTYKVAAWYKSSEPVVFNLYYRTQVGTWKFWATSPQMAAARRWTRAQWTSPAVPTGGNGLSFGLALRSDGTVATSTYSLVRGPKPGAQLNVFSLVGLGILGLAFLLAVVVAVAAAVRRFRHRARGTSA